MRCHLLVVALATQALLPAAACHAQGSHNPFAEGRDIVIQHSRNTYKDNPIKPPPVDQSLFPDEPPLPGARPVIHLTRASASAGVLRVAGTLEGGPVVRMNLLRILGGPGIQGSISREGIAFSGEIDLAPGVANMVTITAYNAQDVGAEYTLTLDSTGAITDRRATSATGEVAPTNPVPQQADAGPSPSASAPAGNQGDRGAARGPAQAPKPPVPGFGGVGKVPGPPDTRQAAGGAAIPAAVAGVLHILAGLFRGKGPGGGGTAPAPPTGAAPLLPQPTGVPQPSQAPAAGHSAPNQPPPLDPVAATTARARSTLDRLDQLGGPEVKAAADRLRQRLQQGAVSPAEWDQMKRDLRDAVSRSAGPSSESLWERIPGAATVGEVGGVVRDGLYATGAAAIEATREAARVAPGVLAAPFVAVGHGLKATWDIPRTLMTQGGLRYFARGADEATRNWIRGLPGVKEQIEAAQRDGTLTGALAAAGATAVTAAGAAGSSLWEAAKNSVVPWDELKTIGDLSGTSTEEKAWAVASGAAKILTGAALALRPTNCPTTSLGAAVADAVDARAAGGLTTRAAELRARSGQLAAAAKLGGAGSEALIDSSYEAWHTANVAEQAVEVETGVRRLMRGPSTPTSFAEARRILETDPALTRAVDDLIERNQGSHALYNLRSEQLLSHDTHTLITARKLARQEEVFEKAFDQVVREEIAQRVAANADLVREGLQPLPIPKRFDLFNGTQGSRQYLRGSNVDADLDPTILGFGFVDKARVTEVLTQQADQAGFSLRSLDINPYMPEAGAGLADASGVAANTGEVMDAMAQQGKFGTKQVVALADGRIGTSRIAWSDQGREALVSARSRMQAPPGVDQRLWEFEAHQGGAIRVSECAQAAALEPQVEGILKACDSGQLVQMCKYANRARLYGLRMDGRMAELVRQVAGQKDPVVAGRILAEAGYGPPAALLEHLGLARGVVQ